MTSLRDEYLPAEASAPAHKPVFKLAPVEDDLTTTILSIRLKVIEDTDLHFGARLMFVYLLDLSLRRSVNVRPGVITISQTRLCEKFGVSTRAVYGWKQELLMKDLVWMSHQPMPNTWPIDTYHITAIHPRSCHEDKVTAEGMWGNGGRRTHLDAPGPGAREPGQRVLPVLRGTRLPRSTEDPKPTENPDFAGQSRNVLPPSAEAGFCPQSKPASAHSRSQLPPTVEAGFCPQSKQASAHGRSQLPPTVEASFRHKKALVGRNKPSRGGGNPPESSLRGGSKGQVAGQPPFRSKVQAQLDLVKQQIRRILDKAESYERRLAPDVAKTVEDLRELAAHAKGKKAADYLADAERRAKNPANFIKGNLRLAAAQELAALKQRKAELEDELAIAI